MVFQIIRRLFDPRRTRAVRRAVRMRTRSAAKRADQAGAAAALGAPVLGAMSDAEAEAAQAAETTVGVAARRTFFRVFGQPRMDEPLAEQFDLQAAQAAAHTAEVFFRTEVAMFPSHMYLYEEIEALYINTALSEPTSAESGNFPSALSEFRDVSNANLSKMLFRIPATAVGVVSLIVFAATAALYARLAPGGVSSGVAALDGLLSDRLVVLALAAVGGLIVAGSAALAVVSVIYNIVFTNRQTQNAQVLNIYITTKMGRINQIYERAKTRCRDIESPTHDEARADGGHNADAAQSRKEREYRENIARVDEEARVWAMAFVWQGVKQLLYEMFVRNTMFRLRRNAWLYSWLGVSTCLLIVIVFAAGGAAASVLLAEMMLIAVVVLYALAGLYMIYFLYSRILADPFQIFFSVLNTNEWNRFHGAALGKSIVDQIHRDKSNIVHFRDRFGMGG